MSRAADRPSPRLIQHRAGDGAPLVLLHGLGGSWRTWLPVLSALEARHDVIALDLPGFGGAPPFADGVRPTVGAYADAVESACEDAGIDRAHIVGNSLGGRIGIELARRGRARTLVAISPSGFELPPERALVLLANEVTRLRTRLVAPHARRLMRSSVLRMLVVGGLHSRPRRLSPAEAAHEAEVFARSPAFQRALWWAGMLDWPLGLRDIRCRTRIAAGTRDPLFLPLSAPRYALAIPGADFRALRGCGHVPMIDDPAQVARVILEITAAGGEDVEPAKRRARLAAR